MEFKEITIDEIEIITNIFVETFNAPPWNDKWTIDTASKRLRQMIAYQDFYGIVAYMDGQPSGFILGHEEQYYNGIHFNIKEFCVKNEMRSLGFGKKIFDEFEKRLKLRGISQIVLLTLKGETTEGFYQKRGLETYGDMIIMGKELTR